jgi:Ricin-type beta-trefoil lectin domain-like
MSVKEEYTPSGNTRSFEQTFDSYVAKNPSKWLLGSSIPTLNQAKGKIVLFRRFGASSTPKGIDASVWPDNTTFTYGNLRVQDNYVVSDNNTKWSQINSMLDEAYYGGAGTLYVNFCSGYKSTFGYPSIPSVSNNINPRVTNYFTNKTYGRYGCVLMDFVDAAKCTLIYNTSYDPIANQTYKVLNWNSGKALDVVGVSTADGADVDQWAYNGGNNQRWSFTALGSGYYKVTVVHSGKALDVSGWSTANGANVHQWTWTGGDNQIWRVVPNTDGTYRLLNKYSGLALDVSGGSVVDGGDVIQWSYGGGANQKWTITSP